MKQCHACGQKLPLKVGEMVEYQSVRTPYPLRRGIVTNMLSLGMSYEVLSFDGYRVIKPASVLTRLHGYYRVTEREPLA